MKKLLSCLLVLAMASVAQATFVLDVTYDDGTPYGGEPILPSTWLNVSVGVTPDVEFAGADLSISLSNNQGALDAADVVFPAPTLKEFTFGAWFINDERAWDAALNPIVNTAQELVITGGNSKFNAINNSQLVENPFGQPPAPAMSYDILLEGLRFHCTEDTDVDIILTASQQIAQWIDHDANGSPADFAVIHQQGEELDRISIHQIPEPMTMALLGLGGLGLLRRRRS